MFLNSPIDKQITTIIIAFRQLITIHITIHAPLLPSLTKTKKSIKSKYKDINFHVYIILTSHFKFIEN